jgi:DNA-binding NarL/FixJ family response regulator
MIDVLIVDDDPIMRTAVRGLLTVAEDIQVVGEAADGRLAVDLVGRLRPAVTLLDHRMPGADGLTVITTLAGQTKVLVLTGDAEPGLIAAMLRGGARGYLVHGEFDPPELLRAVREVAAGHAWMSPVAASATLSALRDGVDSERTAQDRAERSRHERQRFGLTPREEAVLLLVCAGHTNAVIARELTLTEKTVKNHLNHIFGKLGVSNRTEAAIRWSGRSGRPQ